LVPDPITADGGNLLAGSLPDAAPPLLSDSLWEGAVSVTAEEPQNISPPASNLAPRAKLRNEGPRPIGFESPATAKFEPVSQPNTVATVDDASNHVPLTEPNGRSPSSGFGAGFVSAPTITASYNELSNATPYPVTPPPWSAPSDEEGPRRHIVVDGDSLARLAGRYLDDPRRADEIFEANRGVLTDPELLPIGVELVIPSEAATAFELDSPQSLLPKAVAIHAPATAGLVPVRPIPAAPQLVPRAHLSLPMPVQ
jgi:hypothetical protein